MSLTFVDLTELNTLAAESPTAYGGLYSLSPETVVLCLAMMADAEQRWRWRDNGNKLTGSQWDTAAEIVATATGELLGQVNVVDGGNA